MKKNIIIVLAISIILVGFGIYNYKTPTKNINKTTLAAKQNVNTNNIKQQPSTEKALTINSNIDLRIIYKTVDELYNDSNFVIEGKVINTKVFYQDFRIYTTATIQVINDFVGNVGINQEIKVIFRGGTLEGTLAKEMASKIYNKKFGNTSRAPLPNKTIQKINGLENIENGDNLILFLNDNSMNTPDEKYVLTGSYQGRFKIKDNTIELHDELDKAQNSLNKDSFIKYLNNLKK